MLETHATEALTLDVYRGVSPFDPDDDTWYLADLPALHDAFAVTPSGQTPYLACGVAKIEDLREVNVIEGVASIDVGRVRLTELVPLSHSTFERMADQLDDAEARLATLDDEIGELRRDIEEDD